MAFMETEAKNTIEKLRGLPVGKKKIIFFAVVGIAAAGMLVFEAWTIQRRFENTSGISAFMQTMRFPVTEIAGPIGEVKTLVGENPFSVPKSPDETQNVLRDINSSAWEQYQNTTYQFSLRYPLGYAIEEKPSEDVHSLFSVHFTHQKPSEAGENLAYPDLTVKVLSSDLSPEDYIKQNLVKEEFGITQDQVKSTTVNGIDARRLGFKITTPEAAIIHVYTLLLLEKGTLLSVEYHHRDVEGKTSLADVIYEQFLATLAITKGQQP